MATSPGSWVTSATCSRRTAAEPARSRPSISRPWTSTCPSSGRSRPASRCRSVVLPLPDRPTTAVSVPDANEAETPESTGLRAPAKRLNTLRSSATVAPGVAACSWNIAGGGSIERPVERVARQHELLLAALGMKPRRRAERLQQRVRQPHPARLGHDQRRADARASLLDHATVADVDQAVGDRRRRLVVADHERGRPLLACELGDQPVDDRCVLGVQLAGGLVCQQQPGAVGQCGAQGDALLLTARQRPWAGIDPVAEPDALEQPGGDCASLRPRRAEQLEPEADGVDARQIGGEGPCVMLVEQSRGSAPGTSPPLPRRGSRRPCRARGQRRPTAGRTPRPCAAGSTSRSRSARARPRSRPARPGASAPGARPRSRRRSGGCGRPRGRRRRASFEAPGGAFGPVAAEGGERCHLRDEQRGEHQRRDPDARDEPVGIQPQRRLRHSGRSGHPDQRDD